MPLGPAETVERLADRAADHSSRTDPTAEMASPTARRALEPLATTCSCLPRAPPEPRRCTPSDQRRATRPSAAMCAGAAGYATWMRGLHGVSTSTRPPALRCTRWPARRCSPRSRTAGPIPASSTPGPPGPPAAGRRPRVDRRGTRRPRGRGGVRRQRTAATGERWPGSRRRAAAAGPLVHIAVEHSAVLQAATACRHGPRRVPVDRLGTGGPGGVRFAAVGAPGVALAAVQSANHEVGTVQPVEPSAQSAARRPACRCWSTRRSRSAATPVPPGWSTPHRERPQVGRAGRRGRPGGAQGHPVGSPATSPGPAG